MTFYRDDVSKFTRIKHTVRISIILILGIYFGIIALLNVPYIQQALTTYAVKELSRTLATDVRIERIDLGLLNRIIVHNLSLKDRKGEDMLHVSRFSAKIDISPLLHGKIRISSVQLFGLDARLSRMNPMSETNFRFILDALAPKEQKKEKKPLDLRINTILIRRGQIRYDLFSENETPRRFNPAHIALQNLSGTLSLKAFTPDSLNAQIKRLSFQEKSGFKLKKLSGKVTANRQAFSASNIQLALTQTVVSLDTLHASYDSVPSLSRPGDDFRYTGELNAHIVPSDFTPFLPRLADFHSPVTLTMSFRGNGNDAECTHIRAANTSESILLEAAGSVTDWDDRNTMYVKGNVSDAEINENGIVWLINNLTGKNERPKALQKMQYFRFSGNISGYLRELNTRGVLSSNAGTVNANVTMHTEEHTGLHSYSGKVESRELDLGQLLNNEDVWGKTTFSVELNGLKYSAKRMESYIRATIASLDYKQYNYRNIMLDGQYTKGGFNGRLGMDDRNGQIEVNGLFVTSGQTPEFNLKATLRNFRPNALHLTEKYPESDFSLNLTADFKGHSVDDVEGFIRLDSLLVNSPDSTRRYFLDRMDITAVPRNENNAKHVDIKAPFMSGTIQGDYLYRTVPAGFIRVMKRYIPSLPSQEDMKHEPVNNFRFNFRVDNSEFFAKVLDIPLRLSMPATLEGCFSDKEEKIRVNGHFPEFTYDGTLYESGILTCGNTGDTLQCRLRGNKRLKKGGTINVALKADVKDGRMNTTIDWGNNTPDTYSGKVKAVTRFEPSEENGKMQAVVDIKPGTVILNDTTWNVHPSQIVIAGKKIEINDFLFEHKDQYLRADGRIGDSQDDSCLVDLRNINLKYLMSMIRFRAVQFNGMISGKVHLNHILDKPDMTARLDVHNFTLNDARLGEAEILGLWDDSIKGIRLLADMQEDSLRFTRVNGYISPKQKGLDLHIQAGGTNLAFLQPFVDGIFTNMQGRAYGNVRLFGPFARLDLEGDARADFSMNVDILNSYFSGQSDTIHIRPGEFRFTNVRLSDAEGHSGSLNGRIGHSNLKQLTYDFHIATQGMQVFHSEKETPDFPFYGKIYATGNVNLRGVPGTLNIDGTMRTDAHTLFAYVTSTASEAASNHFITFVDKTPHRKQTLPETELYHPLNSLKKKSDSGVKNDIYMNLQIEATPQATMRVITDASAGDNIQAQGNGNLRLNFYNKGDFQIFGNYNIEQGIYKMSIQNFIRKDFVLQPGGTVSFSGNPRTANLNVQAVYTVNSASLNDLVADASSNRSTVRVNCLMNLTGSLTAPELKFDLELPTVNEEDRELVRSLTSTEEQMNTQIIYLLGVGKFYTYDYAANANQSDATSSLAFSTLSGQLNNMLSQVIDNGSWNVGTNLSTGEKGWSDVEAEAILSGRLLNNRLIINGNFGYKDNPMRNTNFVGDFEAIWLLTKNGEFRLRGYNQTNDRYFTKSTLTTQGIGLMYKKDFTRWKELFDWFLRRRKKRTAYTQEHDKTSENNALPHNESSDNQL